MIIAPERYARHQAPFWSPTASRPSIVLEKRVNDLGGAVGNVGDNALVKLGALMFYPVGQGGFKALAKGLEAFNDGDFLCHLHVFSWLQRRDCSRQILTQS